MYELPHLQPATEEERWVLAWFKQCGPVPGNTPEEQLNVNYFEAQLIDSLRVIELIVQTEEHFRIRFIELHFQDRRFSTLKGLSQLIAELKNSSDGKSSHDE